jgi:plastocyanin
LCIAVVCLITACGGESKPHSAQTAQTSTTTTTTPTAASTRIVSIKDFDFHPKALRVTPGTTVRWINGDSSNHTVTGERGAKFDLGNVDPGHRLAMRFTRPGVYRYLCQYHPNMHASIVVR